MNTSNITIETKNLLIKGITLKYKENIFNEFTPEITTHMYPKPSEKIEETEEFIRKSIKQNTEGSNFQAVILDKSTQNFIGCGGIHNTNRKTPELGIWIKKGAQGHGYGKEAVIALKEWADTNLDYEYLLYPVDAENQPSRRIPGFFCAKIAREYDETSMSGKILHLLEYRIYPNKN